MRFYFPPIDLIKQTTGQLLAANLVAFYAMDSAAGENVPDSHGNSDTLVDANGVDRAAGMNGSAADCDIAANEYLTIGAAGGNTFEFASSFSLAVWVYIVALPDKGGPACYQEIFTRGGYNQGGFELKVAAVGDPIAFIINQKTPLNAKTVHGQCATGKWVLLAAVNDAAASTMHVWSSTSGSMVDSHDTYAFTQGVVLSRDTYVGFLGTGALTGQILVDSIAVFDRALSETEVSWLYNSGNGRSYADFG